MDILLRTPLEAPLFSIGDGVAGPAVLVRRFPDDLEMKIVEISNLFLRVIDGYLVHVRILRFLLREFQHSPARSNGGPNLEKLSSQCRSPFFPLISLEMADETVGFAHTALVPGRAIISIPA